MHLNVSSEKCRPFCLGLNVLSDPALGGSPVETKKLCGYCTCRLIRSHMSAGVRYGMVCVTKYLSTLEIPRDLSRSRRPLWITTLTLCHVGLVAPCGRHRSWLTVVQVMFFCWRQQTFTWTNADLLSVVPLRTNFSEILMKSQTSSSRKMCLKMPSANGGHFVQTSMCLVRWHVIMFPFH